MKKYILNSIPVILMFPAILVGVITMFLNDVPSSVYLQNILCFVVLGISSCFLLKVKWSFFETKSIAIIAVSAAALLLTFLHSGMEGVHRWISLGPISLNVSSIVLPIILISLQNLLKDKKVTIAVAVIACVAIILALQPDASMTTAFSAAVIVLLWDTVKLLPKILLTFFLGILTVLTWIFLDKLAPVEYVEGIFKLVSDIGFIWSVFGVLSLAAAIIPFFIFSQMKDRCLSICFGVYFTAILISTVFGNFPIPLMGYGISPIIGYFIAVMWLTNRVKCMLLLKIEK